ncbi:MAG: hypothetical protein FJ161_02460 [Gammaproteobacteria bacterium]|nr:hypothetical protein [Gammaproteobacteria bacterium]
MGFSAIEQNEILIALNNGYNKYFYDLCYKFLKASNKENTDSADKERHIKSLSYLHAAHILQALPSRSDVKYKEAYDAAQAEIEKFDKQLLEVGAAKGLNLNASNIVYSKGLEAGRQHPFEHFFNILWAHLTLYFHSLLQIRLEVAPSGDRMKMSNHPEAVILSKHNELQHRIQYAHLPQQANHPLTDKKFSIPSRNPINFMAHILETEVVTYQRGFINSANHLSEATQYYVVFGAEGWARILCDYTMNPNIKAFSDAIDACCDRFDMSGVRLHRQGLEQTTFLEKSNHFQEAYAPLIKEITNNEQLDKQIKEFFRLLSDLSSNSDANLNTGPFKGMKLIIEHCFNPADRELAALCAKAYFHALRFYEDERPAMREHLRGFENLNLDRYIPKNTSTNKNTAASTSSATLTFSPNNPNLQSNRTEDILGHRKKQQKG